MMLVLLVIRQLLSILRFFPGKVQKISLNAGFTCPNRDGTVGYGGCTYCNNQTFNPEYCRTEKTVAVQLEEGKRFFAHKYPEMKYLAYFQAYTNTYGELEALKRKYEEALAVDDVVGLVMYGIESTLDRTLRRINRGHTWQAAVDAVERTAARRLPVGGHVILGLPGESREDMLRQAADISQLPLDTLKLHQLQLIRGTRMAREYEERPEDFHLFDDVNEYIALVVDYIQRLRPDLVLERFVSQSPKELLIAPDWGLKNYEFNHRLQKRMKELDAWQGKLYNQ